jgi:hypothetical protein
MWLRFKFSLEKKKMVEAVKVKLLFKKNLSYQIIT